MVDVPHDERSVLRFSGGAGPARERLDDYLWQERLLSTYKETRNGLVGEVEGLLGRGLVLQ